MSPLVASLLLAAAARVENVRLEDVGARTSVRVAWSGRPALVSVQRTGSVARVVLKDAELGLVFAGGTRFAWTSATAPAPISEALFQGLDIESGKGEIAFSFHVPSGTPIDVRRASDHLVVSFRAAGAPAGTLVAAATASPTVPPAPMRQAPVPAVVLAPPPAAPTTPPPVATPLPAPVATPVPHPVATPVPAPVAVPAVEPASEAATAAVATSDLHQRLFPVPADTSAYDPETEAPAADLYSKLFPYAAEAAPSPLAATEAVAPSLEETDPGLRLGPFRVRPGVRAGYVNAEANFLANPVPVRDRYLEVQPKLAMDAAVGAGRFLLTYEPILRAFGSFDVTREPTHPVEATLDAPLGTRGRLKLTDTFVSGVLETTQVDPGGEYFFDLGRFNKNSFGADVSIEVGPRLSLELGGGYDWVDFTEPSSFFGYRRALGSVGIGYETTPNLKTTLSYLYDAVPDLPDRPEATYDAHSFQLGLDGEILPLLRGSLHVGFRDQLSPNAGPEGQRFRGFTAGASLTRDLGREAALTVLVNRSTPLSNYEENAFYVSTAVSASFLAPLPYGIALNAGGGYHWNDYETLVTGADFKREDRIFGWFVGLRRPLDRRTSAFAGYRWERRRSNVEPFENDTDGLLLQIDVDVFGRPR